MALLVVATFPGDIFGGAFKLHFPYTIEECIIVKGKKNGNIFHSGLVFCIKKRLLFWFKKISMADKNPLLMENALIFSIHILGSPPLDRKSFQNYKAVQYKG